MMIVLGYRVSGIFLSLPLVGRDQGWGLARNAIPGATTTPTPPHKGEGKEEK
jgi:type III secretory pathway component EscT